MSLVGRVEFVVQSVYESVSWERCSCVGKAKWVAGFVHWLVGRLVGRWAWIGCLQLGLVVLFAWLLDLSTDRLAVLA